MIDPMENVFVRSALNSDCNRAPQATRARCSYHTSELRTRDDEVYR